MSFLIYKVTGWKAHPLRRGAPLTTVFFLSLSGLFIFFLVVRFDLNVGELWSNITEANPVVFLTAFVLHYTTFVFRGARWRLLLLNAQDGEAPSPTIQNCGGLILVSWFVNCITVLRIGDLYRAHLYSTETGHRLSQTIGTVVAERIVDVFIMFGLLITASVLMVYTGVDTPWFFVVLASAIPFLLAIILIGMRIFKERFSRFLPFSLGEAYLRFHKGALGSYERLPVILVLGFLGWIAEAGRLFLVIQALGFDVNIPLVLFATLANSLLTLLPIGGLGITEFGVAEILSGMFAKTAAGSVVIIDRAISYLSVVVFGGILFLIRTEMNRRIQRRKEIVDLSSQSDVAH